MDWYPLYNSVRIALISTIIIFFAGIAAAYYVARLPRAVKGVLDAVFTLPLVLPPTVVGYLLLRVFGPKRVIGAWVLETFGVKMVMTVGGSTSGSVRSTSSTPLTRRGSFAI